jgi:CheY-like chemotaxis protein
MVTAPTVLIADDHADNRDICHIVLEEIGFIATEAENGSQTIKYLEQQPYTLLLLDLHMPGINGRDVLQWINARSLQKTMCVVVLTAQPHWVTAEIETLAEYVMYKPINIADFSHFAARIKENFAAQDVHH